MVVADDETQALAALNRIMGERIFGASGDSVVIEECLIGEEASIMAITDGVAAAGLSDGASATLGGRTIRVKGSAAYLEDGTLAGSVATMDRVFRFLVNQVGLSLNDAAQLCATTPASELGLKDTGAIAKGAIADLVVMDRDFNVKQTYVGGRLVYSAL